MVTRLSLSCEFSFHNRRLDAHRQDASLNKDQPFNHQWRCWFDAVVYVKLLGACVGCGLSNVTIKMGVESILMDEIPEVTEVRLQEV